MSLPGQSPAKMMGAATRLQSDNASWQFSSKSAHLLSSHPPPKYDRSRRVDAHRLQTFLPRSIPRTEIIIGPFLLAAINTGMLTDV
jgi:hypothetical protein